MTDHPTFITELVQAANEADRLTHPERARLLVWAAATIEALREQAGREAGADDGAIGLQKMAEQVSSFSSEQISLTLRNAAAVIQAAQAYADRKMH